MDDIIKSILQGFPTFAGLVLVIYILWKQNDRLLTVFISELQALRAELRELKTAIQEFKFPDK